MIKEGLGICMAILGGIGLIAAVITGAFFLGLLFLFGLLGGVVLMQSGREEQDQMKQICKLVYDQLRKSDEIMLEQLTREANISPEEAYKLVHKAVKSGLLPPAKIRFHHDL